MKALRDGGAIAVILEKWVPITPLGYKGKLVRLDIWGADILTITGRKMIFIQCCAGTDHSKRMQKCIDNPNVAAILRTGNAFEIWSWAKRGPRGKRKPWRARVSQLVVSPEGTVKPL